MQYLTSKGRMSLTNFSGVRVSSASAKGANRMADSAIAICSVNSGAQARNGKNFIVGVLDERRRQAAGRQAAGEQAGFTLLYNHLKIAESVVSGDFVSRKADLSPIGGRANESAAKANSARRGA